jgi:hypothetical protein
MQDTPGAAIVLGWAFSWSGGLALIILAVAWLVRDRSGRPIGIGSSIIVTLLTLVWTAPIGLLFWFASAFYVMPRME